MIQKPIFEANNELALHVADPVKAAEFYTTVLGCRLVSSDPKCVELVSGALRLFLLADPAPQHEAVVPSFTVLDRGAALASLQEAGCVMVPIGSHAPGEHYVRDPKGILFDIVERQLESVIAGSIQWLERVPSIPMRRGGHPEEVARAILWLLSDEALYATASFIDLAGGA